MHPKLWSLQPSKISPQASWLTAVLYNHQTGNLAVTQVSTACEHWAQSWGYRREPGWDKSSISTINDPLNYSDCLPRLPNLSLTFHPQWNYYSIFLAFGLHVFQATLHTTTRLIFQKHKSHHGTPHLLSLLSAWQAKSSSSRQTRLSVSWTPIYLSVQSLGIPWTTPLTPRYLGFSG